MAKNEIDPISFTREDEHYAGLLPTMNPKGGVSIRRRGRMSGGVRDKITQGIMKASMAALWRDGDTYVEICRKINEQFDLDPETEAITPHTIHYHIKSMLDYWRQKAAARIDERQAAILTRFDQVEALALEGYWASCEGKSTRQKNKQIIRARSDERLGQQVKKEADKRDAMFNGRTTENTRNKKFTWAEDGDLEALEDSLSEVQERIQNNVRTESNHAGDVKFLSLVFQINRERAKILGLYQKRDVDDASGQAAMMSDEQREARVVNILKAAKERREAQANMLAEPAPLGGFQEEEGDPDNVVIRRAPPTDVPPVKEPEVVWDDEDEITPDDVEEVEWD
jgi:hypothetical protein